MAKEKSVRVRYKRLRKAHGYAYGKKNMVELDKALKGKKHMEVLLHEVLHVLFWELDESAIVEKSIILTNTLWEQKYRRICDDNSEPLQDGKVHR